MIELENVKKIHNEGRPDEVVALRGISLVLPAGGITVLKGPSGSGKTTLLTLAGCLARPTEGRVRLNGEPVSALPDHFMSEVRRHAFGFIFQRFNLMRGLGVLENVMLPAYPDGPARRALATRALELLERFHLRGKADVKAQFLSGGEAQRVAIARALINDPAWIIADEPTANLDTRLAERFLEEMARLKAAGKSIVIATHDARVFDAPIVDRVVEMRDGSIVGKEEGRAGEGGS